LKYFVSREGTIEDITVIQSAGADLDQEAIRVVEIMPQWFPGVYNGKFIGVPYNLPIKFTIR